MVYSLKIGLKFNSKLIKSPGLIHYWPFNSQIQDIIEGAHLFNGSKAGLTSDRFGRPLSALILNGAGYYQLPPGNYFQASFTVSAWLYRRNNLYWHLFFQTVQISISIRVTTSTKNVGEPAFCSTTSQCVFANMTFSSYV